MSEKSPNHICRTCGKLYYACPDCDRNSSWKAVACCFECYQKYVDAVIESRKKENTVVSDPDESVTSLDEKAIVKTKKRTKHISE